MKKFVMGVAAVAMLGLAACSNKTAETTESANIDSTADTLTYIEESISVESVSPDSVQITENEEAAQVVTNPEQTPAK